MFGYISRSSVLFNLSIHTSYLCPWHASFTAMSLLTLCLEVKNFDDSQLTLFLQYFSGSPGPLWLPYEFYDTCYTDLVKNVFGYESVDTKYSSERFI
jgi:hypothetical protein